MKELIIGQVSMSELVKYAEGFCMDEYGVEFNIPLVANGRLKRAAGRYITKTSWSVLVPVRIELSKNLLWYAEDEEILDVLRHELIHFCLSVLGRDFRDGDEDFESELRRLGVRPTLSEFEFSAPKHKVVCPGCEITYRYDRGLNPNKVYKCSKCSSRVLYLGVEEQPWREIVD